MLNPMSSNLAEIMSLIPTRRRIVPALMRNLLLVQDGKDNILIDVPDENFTDNHGEHIVSTEADCMLNASCIAATICGKVCMIAQLAMQSLHMTPVVRSIFCAFVRLMSLSHDALV